ncbi:fibrinogen-like protein 1 isoform X7 [Ranitomeya imitator]
MSEGGGWTVFQRRSDGTQNFYRNWTDYKQGFGDFTTVMGEYWLGNDNLHFLTLQDDYILRIDLWDFEGQRRYADYKSFRVGDEESAYQISCGEYSGTAGDSLTGGFNPEVQWWANHNGMKFSTWDRDNDNYEENCAVEDKGGWWYNRCHSTNLNGLYYKGPYTSNTDDGVIWYTWHGWWYSLKYVAMKIRSVNFEPNLVTRTRKRTFQDLRRHRNPGPNSDQDADGFFKPSGRNTTTIFTETDPQHRRTDKFDTFVLFSTLYCPCYTYAH